MLRAMGTLIHVGQISPAALEPGLVAILKELSPLGLQLEGLVKILEAGGPRDESAASRVHREAADLAGALRSLERSIDALVGTHTVEFGSLSRELATRLPPGVQMGTQGLADDLSVRCADGAKARRDLAAVLDELVRNSQKAGGRAVSISGEYQDHGQRVRLVLADDGKGVPDDVVRKLFVSDGSLAEHGLDRARRVLESLGGRIFLANRSEGPGAEVRISLPTHRPRRG
jgi:signal transduction histidine kinase